MPPRPVPERRPWGGGRRPQTNVDSDVRSRPRRLLRCRPGRARELRVLHLAADRYASGCLEQVLAVLHEAGGERDRAAAGRTSIVSTAAASPASTRRSRRRPVSPRRPPRQCRHRSSRRCRRRRRFHPRRHQQKPVRLPTPTARPTRRCPRLRCRCRHHGAGRTAAPRRCRRLCPRPRRSGMTSSPRRCCQN